MRPTSPSSVGRARRFAVTMLATCGTTFAAEPAPAEPAPAARQEAAPGEALEAARRDFQTLKATRDPAQQQKAALPKLGMPSLATGAGEPQPMGPLRPEPAAPPGAKAGNWLVDAMNKSEREAAARSGDRRPDRGIEDFRSDSTMPRSRERMPLGRDDSRLPAVGANPSGTADDTKNPFTRYLGEWMTPSDYAALKPALDVPIDSRAGAERRPSTPPPDVSRAALGLTGPDASRGLLAAKPPAAPRENPYLQALPPVASATAATPGPAGNPASPAAGFTPAAPAVRPAVTAPPAAPQTAPRSQIPDFLKPARDEKYFKQLKRF